MWSGAPASGGPEHLWFSSYIRTVQSKGFFFQRKMRLAWFFMSVFYIGLFSFFPCSFHSGGGNLCCIGVVKNTCSPTVYRNKCFFVFQKMSLSDLSYKASLFTIKTKAIVIFRINRYLWSYRGLGTFILRIAFNF